MKNKLKLIDYIQDLRKKGRYLFLKEEVSQALGLTNTAVLNSIHRLIKKGKIVHLKKGLYQIILEEYANDGSLPPEWFIDDLMTYLEVPYYVSLLTAASLHGSSHQAPQIFQVICGKVIPSLTVGSVKIVFYYSKDISDIPTQKIKVPSGYMNVSTPEGTAFDLMRYLQQSGHLNHVATVLSELAEVMDGDKLALIGNQLSVRYGQRLGYILDELGFDKLTKPLYEVISKKTQTYILLRSDTDNEITDKNQKWRIQVNEALEIDI